VSYPSLFSLLKLFPSFFFLTNLFKKWLVPSFPKEEGTPFFPGLGRLPSPQTRPLWPLAKERGKSSPLPFPADFLPSLGSRGGEAFLFFEKKKELFSLLFAFDFLKHEPAKTRPPPMIKYFFFSPPSFSSLSYL